ncbi:hypothetical protein QBC33DRAFT_122085 [Phialemonium atrogriseum]|uniref:Uncharacterized protein n=1 Tax=Phialemonium atrogriseum TaxID=1093897 RepID=A0AAJ0C1H2_9PEZI|nr:uncharacterized protein QBC33DRAFT_122085 [Phialemonium atrogriseum]KAK1765966.1 hypothetical protein QBC33DRAFT_122085 [Phialemonium atrogriseum]
MLLNHDDLLEMDIHMDKATGSITLVLSTGPTPRLPRSARRLRGLKPFLAFGHRRVGSSIRAMNISGRSFGRLSTGSVGIFRMMSGEQWRLEGYSAYSEPTASTVGLRRRKRCL